MGSQDGGRPRLDASRFGGGPPVDTQTSGFGSSNGRMGGGNDITDSTLDDMKRNLNQGISNAERCIDQQKVEYEREVRKLDEERQSLAAERQKLAIDQQQLGEKESQLNRELEEVDRLRAAVEVASAKKK